jgi:thioester reductase-like protein
LAEEADAIVHCAAMVDLLHDYAHHRPANVEGTARVLELAACGAAKPVHHLSSLSVAAGDGRPFRETRRVAAVPPPKGGYGFSKWIAEQLVEQARERGVDATTLRLGEVMPHAALGISNPRSLAHLLVRACLALEVYPAGLVTMDYSPADWVARQVVEAVMTPDIWGSTLHVHHPRGTTLDDIMECFRALGAPLEPVAAATFVEALESRCEADGDRGLNALLCLLLAAIEAAEPGGSNSAVDVAFSDLFVNPADTWSRRITSRLLDTAAAAAPEIDSKLLRPFLAQLGAESAEPATAWNHDAKPAWVGPLHERSVR